MANEAFYNYLLVFFFMAALSAVETQDTDCFSRDRSNHRLKTITTVLIEPYVMKKNTSRSKHGGLPVTEMYEGFIVDLLERLSADLKFEYCLFPTPDGQYGMKTSDDTWDGMIGELVRQEAEMAAGPMFRTVKRSEVVNFTTPYLTVRATMIMKKPSHGGPRGITKIEDLIDRHDVEFGTLDRGVIKKSLRASSDTTFKKLLSIMNSFKPKAHTKTNAEGIERVRRDDNYIFILPHVIGEYMASKRPCDLHTEDRFLMEEGFSFAFKIGSYLLPYVNHAIQDLRANGFIDKLYKKWWFDKADCDVGPSEKTFRSVDYEVIPQSLASNNGNSNGTFGVLIVLNLVTFLTVLYNVYL